MQFNNCRFVRVGSVSTLPEFPNLAVTVGNFDGLHLGHQSLLNTLKQRANGAATAMLTFYPHPQDYFRNTTSSRLFSLRERYLRAASFGLDYFIVMRFDEKLAALLANQFIDDVLVRGFNTSIVVVGSEWRFGKGRTGTVDLLREQGKLKGFEVETPLVMGEGGAKISSSDLKKVLGEGDLVAYKKFSGRDYEFWGRVVKGDQRGRQLGFRTANAFLRNSIITVKNGVYKTTLRIIGEDKEWPAVTNVGIRPTVAHSAKRVLVESHILEGFDRDIYGKRISVKFLSRIRDEKKFNSLDELKAQIADDISVASN